MFKCPLRIGRHIQYGSVGDILNASSPQMNSLNFISLALIFFDSVPSFGSEDSPVSPLLEVSTSANLYTIHNIVLINIRITKHLTLQLLASKWRPQFQ